MAALYVAKGEGQQAVARVHAQLRMSPNNAFMYDLLGRLYMALNQDDMAEEAFKQAIKADEHFLTAYTNLGLLYMKQRAYDRAIQQYESLIKTSPQLLPPYILLGTIYDYQGQHQQANEQYQKALAINPHSAPAANNLAWNYAEYGGNLDAALALAQTAKAQFPNATGIADTLGWIYYKKNIYLKAIGLLKDSSEKQPENPVHHYHLGMAYAKNGDTAFAKQALTKALQLSQDFAGAQEARAMLATLR
jgi:tetratricopeptide (TPR) repeat protein